MGTPDSQPYDESEKMERYGLKNIDTREREKLERTAADAERLAGLIRNYLRAVDFCTEKGIPVTRRTDLSNIRLPDQLADPSDGGIAKLSAMFESGQTEIIGHIPHELKAEIESRMEK
jgi:hypothetical protein